MHTGKNPSHLDFQAGWDLNEFEPEEQIIPYNPCVWKMDTLFLTSF